MRVFLPSREFAELELASGDARVEIMQSFRVSLPGTYYLKFYAAKRYHYNVRNLDVFDLESVKAAFNKLIKS